MKLNTITEIYELISRGTKNVPNRNQSIKLRKEVFAQLSTPGFTKLAFDTRRIDQETEYNPRRGLQNYLRSESFVSDSIAKKVMAFTKLANLLDKLKIEYGKEPEWQDSYTRVLHSAINKGLKNTETQNDYSDAQPSMASLDYLDELIDVRYRLNCDNLIAMDESSLRTAILKKDDLLTKKAVLIQGEVTTTEVISSSYDQMVDKMLKTMAAVMHKDDLASKLFDVKATADGKGIERTITIKIRDEVLDDNKSLKKSADSDIIIED
jgi:hypothetical protein